MCDSDEQQRVILERRAFSGPVADPLGNSEGPTFCKIIGARSFAESYQT